MQDHTHGYNSGLYDGGDNWMAKTANGNETQWRMQTGAPFNARVSTVTRGKRKGVKYIIKVL
jgi:hypothetical protein